MASQQIFTSCDDAAASGQQNIPRGSPYYSANLDRNNNGVACESGGGDGTTASSGTTQSTAPSPSPTSPTTPTSPPTTTAPSPRLPTTGQTSAPLLAGALLMLLTGAALTLTAARMRIDRWIVIHSKTGTWLTLPRARRFE